MASASALDSSSCPAWAPYFTTFENELLDLPVIKINPFFPKLLLVTVSNHNNSSPNWETNFPIYQHLQSLMPFLEAWTVVKTHGTVYLINLSKQIFFQFTYCISKESSDSLYKIFENLWKYNENNDVDWLLIAPLDKLTKKNTELCDKLNQLLHLSIWWWRTTMNSMIKLTSSRCT